ncbi:MAG: tyrosine-type recombinase/integrase [Lachnospiraceae bacterium]|jgi:integrase/recombinase XerD|nr:tyrosine-type recombinase/integrase [Lachnospiraceae bacterium]MCI9135612.1 tyrosine-type recombinase/integrase [Lachnospiraceae bacterium]
MDYQITEKMLDSYEEHLIQGEYAKGSIEKYLRDIRAFLRWAGKQPLTKELTGRWKEKLVQRKYAPVTVNSMLSALNGILEFLELKEYQVKFIKIQRKTFREQERELSREEYERLLLAARKRGNIRLELLLETICATGIRVSEVRHVTVEAVRQGRACISLKGKVRTILIPAKLGRKLSKYCRKWKIKSGEIFLTKRGNSLTRRQIWGEMKNLCEEAEVESSKVFPHNLRHLFARTYYKVYRDIVKLADILGHSSVETTRIYLISTGEEHARQIDRLGLVS